MGIGMPRRLSVMVWVLAAGLACEAPVPEQEASGPDEAPAFSVVRLSGDSVRLADLRGEVVLLNVWATWCVPCRQEAPELQALHETYADSGLHVVGVTVDNRGVEDQIHRFIDDFGMTYDIWWDPDGTAIEAFGAVGVPLTVLIGRDGVIEWRHLGAFMADNPELREAVRATL